VCICGEIVDVMPLSQATVSQHLKVLREAGLIRGEIDGPRSCYCIDETRMRELRERIEQLFSSLESCCRQGDGTDEQERPTARSGAQQIR
jgi:ArsR family transcriptional regulator